MNSQNSTEYYAGKLVYALLGYLVGRVCLCVCRCIWGTLNASDPPFQSRLRAPDLLHSCSVCTVTKLGYLSGWASREHPQLLNQTCTKWQRNTPGGFRHDKRMNHPNRLALLLKQAFLGFSANTPVATHLEVQGEWSSLTLNTVCVCLCFARASVFWPCLSISRS